MDYFEFNNNNIPFENGCKFNNNRNTISIVTKISSRMCVSYKYNTSSIHIIYNFMKIFG